MQAMQPWILLPESWTNSVVIPSFSSSLKTCLIKIAVLPSLRALPLNATTFINSNPLVSFFHDAIQMHFCIVDSP
jgi:hypothetical protein